jgi:DNA-binding SARP family transcriptional activator
MSAHELRLELFGAPRVMRGSAEVRLPVKKSLALLAYLAIEGRATRAKLAALFWTDSGAEAARRNLRRELHRLREAGLADLLVADDESVALGSRVSCDIADFSAALRRDDCKAALAAWTGPLMDGFDLAESEDFERWLAARRDDFARRFAAAMVARAGECESAGDARGALALYAHLLQQDPLQESHYANAMRLHYLLGERTRALDLYERCRLVLRGQLALDPLPATAALAEQIRAAERVAPIMALAGRGVASLESPLVGRGTELASLASCATVAVLIEGDAGVGKSRLALEYALDRSPYLRAKGSELGREAALHPVLDTLRQAAQDPALSARLTTLPAADRAELGRVLPQFGDAVNEAEGPTARSRFFKAIASALATAGAGGCLVVDDLQWLDDSSLEALEQLVKHLTSAPHGMRVVFTARSAELDAAQTARELVRRLERSGALTRLRLEPLSEDGTLQLVRELSGTTAGHRFAQRLQRSTQGNPFFVLETIRFLFDVGELALDDRGYWSTPHDADTDDYSELPVPPTVQKAVLERIERLGPAARRILETAALAGDGFTLGEVQPATALSDWDAMDGVERAFQAQLLAQSDDDGYRFVHDLTRMAVDGSLPPERRRLIHKRLAATLIERRGRADRIAVHLEGAGALADAVGWRINAAEEAERHFARTEAIFHYLRALEDGADGARAVSIRIGLIKVRRALGQSVMADVAADFAAIDALLPGVDDPALRYRSDMLRVLFLMDNGRHTEAWHVVERLLAMSAPTPNDEVRTLYLASHCATFGGDAPRAIQYGERGRALALVTDSPDLISVETSLTHSYVHADRAAEGVALADLALARIGRKPLADPVFRANLLAAGADAYMASGKYAEAESMLEEGQILLEQANAPAIKVSAQIALAVLHAKAGYPDKALSDSRALAALVGETTNPRFVYMQSMVDAHVRLGEGAVGAAIALLDRALSVAELVDNTLYRRNARLMRARTYEDLLDFEAAIADAEAAPASTSIPGPNPVLIREAAHAASEVHHGHAIAARDRLRAALACERFVDDHVNESRELCRAVLAEALVAVGDPAGAVAVLAQPIHTPALRARAVAARLRAERGSAVVDLANQLLQSGRVAPLATLRLLVALAETQPESDRHRKRARQLIERLSEGSNERLFAHWTRRLKEPVETISPQR